MIGDEYGGEMLTAKNVACRWCCWSLLNGSEAACVCAEQDAQRIGVSGSDELLPVVACAMNSVGS